MDIGKFKASRARLTAWILVPPFLATILGLTAYALRLQSEWQLNRVQAVADVLPLLSESRAQASEIIEQFAASESARIQTEDELISFLQNAAHKVGFTVDSLKVERRVSVQGGNLPVLVASVKGTGPFSAVEMYLGDVTAEQHLLYESALQISQVKRGPEANLCRADFTLELLLFDALKPMRRAL